MNNFTFKLPLILIIGFLFTACDGAYSEYSDYDLKEMYGKCDYNKLTAAGAQRCNNIKKECDTRQKEKRLRC